jgi:hypothetical protein
LRVSHRQDRNVIAADVGLNHMRNRIIGFLDRLPGLFTRDDRRRHVRDAPDDGGMIPAELSAR